jgi:TusA-related sulfurtransferase
MPEESVEVAVPVERLDLRGVLCPMNYVRTKLALERIAQGECVEVLLDTGDPIRNVPSSVSDEGHEVLSVTPQESAFRVMIRKRSV